MSQQPAHKRMDTSRDAIWTQIRKQKRFTVSDVAYGLPTPASIKISSSEWLTLQRKIREYLTGMEAAGFIEKDGLKLNRQSGQNAQAFKLLRDVGVDAPRVRADGSEVTQGKGREQMWRTMRILTEFSILDLAAHSTTDEHPVSESDAKSYCRHLHAAGYLAMPRKGKSGQPAIYRFLPTRYSGPKPPQIQRVNQVYDPNTRKVVWTQEIPHE